MGLFVELWLNCAVMLAEQRSDLSTPLPVSSSQHVRLDLQHLARQTTVRLMTGNAAGSGVLVQRQGRVYTVLTNWHVVSFSNSWAVITPDGRHYSLIRPPMQLGKADLAIAQFVSSTPYTMSRISTAPLTEGEPVYAAGFPMYHRGTLATTLDLGVRPFRFTEGRVSLLLPKSLYQGYRLGYTNDIEVGMSGGPIFNARGLLVGLNGRAKYRDPDFGVYTFEDGTDPPPALLEQMVSASWGIPISTYLQFGSVSP